MLPLGNVQLLRARQDIKDIENTLSRYINRLGYWKEELNVFSGHDMESGISFSELQRVQCIQKEIGWLKKSLVL